MTDTIRQRKNNKGALLFTYKGLITQNRKGINYQQSTKKGALRTFCIAERTSMGSQFARTKGKPEQGR